jgi:hypothetical protein
LLKVLIGNTLDEMRYFILEIDCKAIQSQYWLPVFCFILTGNTLDGIIFHFGNLFQSNMVVSNHFHSVKNFFFSSAKPRDFDGMLGTGPPVSMYTTKSPIDKCHFNVTQLKEFFTFSVKDIYQLNYFICIKDFNAQTITSLKLNLFYFFIYRCQHHESKTTCLDIFLLSDRQCCTNTSIYSVVFLASPYYNYL